MIYDLITNAILYSIRLFPLNVLRQNSARTGLIQHEKGDIFTVFLLRYGSNACADQKGILDPRRTGRDVRPCGFFRDTGADRAKRVVFMRSLTLHLVRTKRVRRADENFSGRQG